MWGHLLALGFPKDLELSSLDLFFFFKGIHIRDASNHWGVGGTQSLLEAVGYPVDRYVTKAPLAGRVQAENWILVNTRAFYQEFSQQQP